MPFFRTQVCLPYTQLDSPDGAEMGITLRNGKVAEYKELKTKGFNVKGRASYPHPSNVFISTNFAARELAGSYGVLVFNPHDFDAPAATLENAFEYEGHLDRFLNEGAIEKRDQSGKGPGKYLLVSYGDNYLYFAQAPLFTREQHPNPAEPKKDAIYPDGDDADEIEILVEFGGPVVAGAETPSRQSVMGGSALDYAKATVDSDWAEERRWEWLHIVGHALGGANEVGNLVAGTFDANTQMIPLERSVRDLSQSATPQHPVYVGYKVDLYPGTRVADFLTMGYGWAPGKWLESRSFKCTTMLCFDKLLYDLWSAF
jgi:hypothetical protein